MVRRAARMPCLTENEICRCMPVSVSMKPRKRNMHRVAQHARGPKLAGCCSAADRRWPASRKGCCRPARVAPARGRNRPREMLLALAPARTLTDRPAALCVGAVLPAMSATGPFRSDPAAPSFARAATGKPARWLAWPLGRVALALGRTPKPDAASGTAMAAASPRPPPHVRALDRGHSLPPGSKRSRSIRQRKHGDYRMGCEGVEKVGASERWPQARNQRN